MHRTQIYLLDTDIVIQLLNIGRLLVSCYR